MKLKGGGITGSAIQRTVEQNPIFRRSADFPRLIEIDLDRITPRADQPRRHFDEGELRALADSIAAKGLLQPILARAAGPDSYEIVAGERRWRACRMLGRATIFAIITDGDPVELALIENLQRVDLSPLEEARAIRNLIDTHGYRQEDAGAVIGWSLTQVNQSLTLLKLPESVLDELVAPQTSVPKAILVQIARETDPDLQMRLWQMAKDGASERELRAARQAKSRPPATASSSDSGGGGRRVLSALATLHGKLEALPDTAVALDARQRAMVRGLRDRLNRLLGE